MSIPSIAAILLLVMTVSCAGQGTSRTLLKPSDNWQIKRATDKKISYSVRSSTNTADEIAQVEFERERPGDRDYQEGFEAGIEGYLQLIRTLSHESIDVKKLNNGGGVRKGIVGSRKDHLRFEYRIFATQDIMLTGHLSATQDNFAELHSIFDEFFTRMSRSPWQKWPEP